MTRQNVIKRPTNPKRSIGKPFWIGWLFTSILSFVWVGSGYDVPFWYSAPMAVVILGPLGGAVSQVTCDLIVARRLRLLHLWEYSILLSIGVALVVASFGLFHSSDKALDPFKNKTFAWATSVVIALVVVYAMRKKVLDYLSQHTFRAEVLDNESTSRIRIFAAGAFSFMFFRELLNGFCEIRNGIVAGKPMWFAFVCDLILSGIGIALGLALLKGNRRAITGARFLLSLIVAGGCVAVVMSILGAWPRLGDQDIIDVIMSAAILALLTTKSFGGTAGDNH